MNFRETECYLLSLGNEVETMKLGLDNIRKLLATLGSPQNNYLKVQIAGTNGKGSVCAFVDSICREAGIRTGVFSSPHLISITERVRIGGVDISEQDFARHATTVREISERMAADGRLTNIPTFFEQVTAIALLAFADANVDLAIVETGLGGRLDATTAADAQIAAITRIDLDHQEYLGNTIEEIAAEKAAILHKNSKVAIGAQSDDAMQVILRVCDSLGIQPLLQHALDMPPLGLQGDHQLENAQVAVGIIELLRAHFQITDDQMVRGLQQARHTGRLEFQGRYLFDGAHNVGGVRALAAFLDRSVEAPITLIFGAMKDKNASAMLRELGQRAEATVVTQVSNLRSMHYAELANSLPEGMSRARTFVTDSPQKALLIAETITPAAGIILVCGSLYLVGEVKKLLRSQI